MRKTISPILILKFICVSLFLGQAWRHLYWDIPIRALLEKSVTFFGYSRQNYIENARLEWSIDLFVFSMGLFYLYCAYGAFRFSRNRSWTRTSMFAGSGALFLLAGLVVQDPSSTFSQALEFASQIAAILSLVYLGSLPKPQLIRIMRNHRARFSRPVFLMQLAVALTFLGHGVYALEILPLPDQFIQITLNIFPVTEQLGRDILYAAGILNVFAAFAVFLPPTAKYALWYCAVWGSIAAFGGFTAFLDFSQPEIALTGWLHVTMFQIANGGLPLCLYLVYYRESEYPLSNKLKDKSSLPGDEARA